MRFLPASFVPVLFAVVSLAGCAADRSVETVVAPPPPPRPALYQWHDDGGPEDLKVRINLSAQRAYFTRGERPVGWSYVATGKEGHNTPAGSYRITEKKADKYSNKYGWIESEAGETINHDATPGDSVPDGARYVPAPMPYWMRLTSTGIGMHAGYIPQPGLPASHGCIRLPKPFAPILFEAVKVGTPVEIEYGPLGPGDQYWESLPKLPAAPVYAPDGREIVSPYDPWIVR